MLLGQLLVRVDYSSSNRNHGRRHRFERGVQNNDASKAQWRIQGDGGCIPTGVGKLTPTMQRNWPFWGPIPPATRPHHRFLDPSLAKRTEFLGLYPHSWHFGSGVGPYISRKWSQKLSNKFVRVKTAVWRGICRFLPLPPVPLLYRLPTVTCLWLLSWSKYFFK